MNEALKPDVAERAAPTIPETPPGRLEPEAPPPLQRPPRRRRLLVRIGLVLALAVAAVFAWQRFEKVENNAPSTAEGPNTGRSGQPPQTVRVAPVTVGDMPITIDALGTVTPFETVTIRTQIAGKLQELGFEEGQTVKKGRLPRPDRSEALPSRARPGAGPIRQGPGAARPGAERSLALRSAEQTGLRSPSSRWPTRRALVAQDKAAIVDRPGAGADGADSISTILTSFRRSLAGRDCGPSTPAIICSPPTPTASSSSRRSIRSASSSRRPKTTCPASRRGSTPAPS